MAAGRILPVRMTKGLSEHGLLWAPVRHHSPQCAWQVRRLIEAMRPDVVLVEGPSEANHLLGALLDEQTRPPVAFFIHSTAAGRNTGARCFVPLAAMSPEWVALREAHRLGIEARFIDLPFRARLALLGAAELEDLTLEPPLNDDRPLARGKALSSLLARSGCSDFEQWWERHFESGIDYPEARAFFANLLQLGQYLRSGSEIDALTHAREAHMAAVIAQAMAEGKRCLVVCGAFHCQGIIEQLAKTSGSPAPALSLLAQSEGVHLVRYSLQRLNSTAAYAAGIPDCAYQARVWSLLARRRERVGDAHVQAQSSLAAELLGELQRRRLPAALPDAIDVLLMAQRLAALRGHRLGRSEFREALLNTLVKTQLDGQEQPLLEVIDKFLAGNDVGRLPATLPVAPLVKEFRQQCRRLRLPRAAGTSVERALELYRSPLHREQSRLLHRLASLDVPYARYLAGPRFSAAQDLARVREVWSICWQPDTEALLTERSHYGERLVDAATARCRERMADARRHGRECISLLIDALCMGLHELLTPLLEQTRDWLDQAFELPELCRALHLLDAARHARSALEGPGLQALDQLLGLCFQRICQALPRFACDSEDRQDTMLGALTQMLNLVMTGMPGCEAESLYEALELLLKDQPSSALAGLANAALLEAGRRPLAEVTEAIRAFGAQAWVDSAAPGRFMHGFLKVARYRLLQESSLQYCLGEVLRSWDETHFLQALPELRLAFTQYSPRQLAQLAKALQQDADQPWSLAPKSWSVDDLALAARLRAELADARHNWVR